MFRKIVERWGEGVKILKIYKKNFLARELRLELFLVV